MTKQLLPGIVIFLFAGLYGLEGFSQDDKKRSQDSLLLELSKEAANENIPVLSLDDNELGDGLTQNVSSQLTAGRDPFINAANFRFSAVRFRIRGYEAENFSTYMNGAPMETLDNGFTPYGLWGGLNDVFRNRDNSIGLRPLQYSFGDIGGLTYFDTRASYQRKQTYFSYAQSNRNYSNRWMVTHSTGLNQKGWAFSFSGSRRWAEEGFTDGTFYDGWSFFAAVDKRVNANNLVSLVAFATPTKQGRQGAAVQEIRDIAGSNFYNPLWGYQNGKKRNSSIVNSFQPVIILTHDWKVNDKVSVLTAGTMVFGNRSITALDWYNVADPRPDYYRYLPSYQLDPAMAQEVRENLQNDVNIRQINWNRLYNANYCSFDVIQDANGIKGNDYSGRRSHYIVENRVVNTTRFNFASTLNAALSEHVDFSSGVTFQSQNNNYYKEVNDLLGGEFYVDINQFAERDFPANPQANQNDLNNPNRILFKGDKFGYNYDINIKRAGIWAQAAFKYEHVDFFIATEQSFTSFYRFGNVRSGLFPNNSYGKSATQGFYNYAFKSGVTYKIDGRNYVYSNLAYLTRAPFFENAYIAPRTRDLLQDNLTSEKVTSFEGGYAMNAPRVKIRANLFYTRFRDQLNVLTFYNDEYRNFVNYALSNIGKTHMGIELAGEAKVYKGLSVNAAASIGNYRYDTRQSATVTIDNSAQTVLTDGVVYSKNFYVPTPQNCFTVGLDYRSPRFWFVNMNLNYFSKMYLDFNPVRRTESAVNGVDPKSELWSEIIDQTRVPSQFTVDVFGGWSWRMNNRFPTLKKQTYLVFNLGVSNLLNNTNMISGGFEQLRFDFAEKNVDKFPNKSFYAYGVTFFASAGLRF